MRLLDSELNLSRHRFKKLPKCRAIFEKYTENSAENQTRRAVWAYMKLKTEGKKHICSTDIGRLAGFNKEYVERIIPLLGKYTDKETEDEIKRIFEKKNKVV